MHAHRHKHTHTQIVIRQVCGKRLHCEEDFDLDRYQFSPEMEPDTGQKDLSE